MPLTAGQGSFFIQAPRTPRAADTERFVPEFFPFTGEPPGTPSLGELGGLQSVPVPAARGRSKHCLGEHEEVAPGLQGIGSGNLAKGSSKALGPGRASSLNWGHGEAQGCLPMLIRSEGVGLRLQNRRERGKNKKTKNKNAFCFRSCCLKLYVWGGQ